MPETRDLDDRIRELVARAVADAPPPPELDPASVPLAEPTPGHRRWWIGGGAALVAAAALIAAFVLVGDSDDTVSTPATDATVVPTTTPATPAPTTTPPPVSAQSGVLTAGPEGVVEHRGTETRTLTSEPMMMALDAGDGRVIVQRQRGDGTGQGWTDADTVPRVLAADGSLTELFGTADWDGGVVLHDIEVVDGRRLLLYSLEVAMSDPEAADETLYVVDLETQDRTEVAAGIGGWEYGTGRLHLATTGLIVGEESAGVSHGIFIDDVPTPGVAAGLPVATDLGLEESYGDCGDCPRGFTVAGDGATFAWIDGDELVVRVLGDENQEQRTALSFTPGCCGTLDRVAGADSFLWSVDAPVEPQPPRLIAPDGSAAELERAVATASPVGGDVSTPAPPPSTTSPLPPTTSPPPAPPIDDSAFVTAGPDGVVDHRGTESRTLTTEPMAIALDAGDGRVIVQRRRGDGAGQGWTDVDTAPLVLGADGSLRPLFDTVDWDGGVVLHDIEVVDGHRLLLFSLQVAMNVNPENADETLYVVDLETQDRTEVAAAIGGWESGTGRLHLATNGVIVGERTSGPTTEPLVLAVPGSPAEALLASPSSAPLGWEPTTDCADCQRAYTIAPDGRSVGWLEGDELVTAEIDGLVAGPEERHSLDSAVPTSNVRDLDFDDTRFLLSYLGTEPLPAPVMLPADNPSAPPMSVEGRAAAIAPGD